MQTIEIPLRRVITPQFNEAFTALCRAKGLDVKLCFPLAKAKRQLEAAVKKFVDDRTLAATAHGAQTIGETFNFPDASHRDAFTKEVVAMLDETVKIELPCLAKIEAGALTPDVMAEVLEFLEE